MKMTGAQIFLEMLRLYEVRHVFGLPGETTLALYKYWTQCPDIRHILTHDERSAAFMAEAYAKVTGRVGVSEAPSPGGAHPAPGVLESQTSAVPTVCFTSDVPWNNDKRNMLSAFDQNGLYRAITKESLMVTKAKDLPFIIRRAFRTATADKPGAVHVKIPMDVFKEDTEVTDLYADPCGSRWPAWRPVADFGQIEKAIDLLAAAKAPVIVCGKGALDSGAGEAVTKLAEMLQIPIGTTMSAKGAISEAHPLSIRVIGSRGGTSFSNQFIKDADLVFFIGSNTDSAGTDGWQLPSRTDPPKIIHLDISGVEAGNNYPLQAVLVGDAKATVEFMNERIVQRGVRSKAENACKVVPAMKALDDYAAEQEKLAMQKINPLRLVRTIHSLINDDAYIVLEPSIGSVTALAFMKQTKPGRKYITNYSHGALGYAAPASLAVAVAHPEATVVAVDGDGSFHFACGELETISRCNANIKLILLRNDVFGWIKGETRHVYHAPFFATNFDKTDYCKVAEGFGLKAFRVTKEEELEPVLKEAFSTSGPVLVEVAVPDESNVVPPVPRWIPSAKENDCPFFY
ncbi:MAG: thiamine pyrophosphate-binding protein [Synergistes sp.]|nr:thiamine pyrophosphate-binding protein [Synergistes sp.]